MFFERERERDGLNKWGGQGQRERASSAGFIPSAVSEKGVDFMTLRS